VARGTIAGLGCAMTERVSVARSVATDMIRFMGVHQYYASFQRDGHVLVPGIASRDEIDSYRPAIEGVVNDVSRQQDSQGRIDDYSKLFTQVTNIWRLNEAARHIVFTRHFAEVAAALLGADSVRLYHDQALFKPPGADRTPWHQDRYYWPLDTDKTLTMWLPLVDVDAEMGPITFASGSHGASGLGDLAISGDTDRKLAALIRERKWPVWCEPVRAGDATFHAGGTLHSARANRSQRVRAILTVIYFAAGTRVAEPENDNQRVDLEVFVQGARVGEEAASELNPLLFP
jgi:ectoine hydroxylase-related dioxygenase (phytanoyl-CoA dioxygenase family)